MDDDIVRLREIHAEIDEAVREAYALDEEQEPGIREYEARVASAPLPGGGRLSWGMGFMRRGRGFGSPSVRRREVDVLDKLLALNHYRYEQEVRQGLHSGKGRAASRGRGAARAASRDRCLFWMMAGCLRPEGTLF